MIAPEERQFFTPRLAMATRHRKGENYTPANGTEGEIFESLWCEDCLHGEACKIRMRLYLLQKPKQVRYGDDGHPLCTAHVEK